MKKISCTQYIVSARSELGDEYGPFFFQKRPTNNDLYEIIKGTGEKLHIGGPGEFGSYVHLKVKEVEITK